jgi:uncharacterized protein (TIRG00374 family)
MLAATVAVLALAVLVVDWRALLSSAGRLSPGAIAACFAICALTHLLIALRWSLIVTLDAPRAGRAALALRELLAAMHSQVFNLVTPGALGADVHRVVDGKERRGGRAGSAGYVLLERILGVAAQAALFLIGFLLARGSSSDVGSIWIFVLLAIAVLFAAGALWIAGGLLAKWIGTVPSRANVELAQLLDLAATALAAPLSRLILLFALSLCAVALWIAAALPLAYDIGLQLPFPALVMVAVITEFSRLLPISIQGIGVREATFAYFTAEFGGAAADGFVVCATLYLVNYLVVGLLGLFAAMLRARLDNR